MGCLRPATPGFLVTLVATILLAVVTFCVPYFKSIYFLEATFTQNKQSGTITLGTLGYCLNFSNNVTCSHPSVGYQIDLEGLGLNLPFNLNIDVVSKWITYALVLHPVALVLAAGSSLFGLLAHVREISMACCSTCISGFAAGVALLAFIFDIVMFFLAKSAINEVGSASMGNAMWLTLAAWILLFFSGCFFTLGRCCINKREPRHKKKKTKDYESGPDFGEQLRLDAVKAEADRKNRTKMQEGGLPAFYEHQPLTGHVDGNDVYIDDPHDKLHSPAYGGHPAKAGGYAGGGYVPGNPGDRTVDDYYNPSQTTYPPTQPAGPRRQQSAHSYAPSTYSYNAPQTTSPPPMPVAPATNYLSPGHEYGHTAGGTTYHSAVSHGPEPSNYSQYDPYENNPYPTQTSYPTAYHDPYAANRIASPPMPAATPSVAPSSGYYPSSHSSPAPERSYTLSGDGYGANTVPALVDHNTYAAHDNVNPYTGGYASGPSTVATDFANPHPSSTSTPQSGPGLRPRGDSEPYPDQPPPTYSEENGGHTGNWGKH